MNSYFLKWCCSSRKKLIYTASAVLALAGLSFLTPRAYAYIPSGSENGENFTSIAAAPNGGYWVQVDGENGAPDETRAINGAPSFPTIGQPGTIAAIPGQEGYWVVTRDGVIHSRGTAPTGPELGCQRLSDCSGYPSDPSSNEYITAAAAHPSGRGLWAVDKRGRVWTVGEAAPHGDVQGDTTPTGMGASPSGNGYYIVMRDGGVHVRGDAVFYGSTGGNWDPWNPITGMTLSYDAGGSVNGYWLVAADGGVLSFGNAMFLGSTGGGLNRRVTNIATSGDHRSYAWVHRDGHTEFSQTYRRVRLQSKKWAGKSIDLVNESKGAGMPLAVLLNSFSTSQIWDLWPTNSDGSVVQIRNVKSGLCADIEAQQSNGRVIQWPCKPRDQGWDNQRWLITPAPLFSEFTSVQFPGHKLYVADNLGDLQLWVAPDGSLPDPWVKWWEPFPAN